MLIWEGCPQLSDPRLNILRALEEAIAGAARAPGVSRARQLLEFVRGCELRTPRFHELLEPELGQVDRILNERSNWGAGYADPAPETLTPALQALEQKWQRIRQSGQIA